MNRLFAMLCRKRTYENYWRHQLGCTVRIKHGAFCGRSGRLTALCSSTYGLVAFSPRYTPICVDFADMQREAS